MAGRIGLTLACGPYDRTLALRTGEVAPEGIDLTYLALPPEEIFWRQLQHQEFDVSEMSMSSYTITVSRGESPFVAIPVFPSRFFRHGNIYVNASAGIAAPEDLRGRRVGVAEYQMTATVFIRGLLQHDHGVLASDLHWRTGGQEHPGRLDRVAMAPPPGVDIQPIPEGRTLSEMLDCGDLDALIAARAPSCFDRGSPNVRRLFPDYARREREHYDRTRIFPIMHCIAIRREVHRRHPWVAQSLFKAFREAKDRCLAFLGDSGTLAAAVPWLLPAVEESRAAFGPDFWPYGVEANRPTLEAFVRFEHEQGLTARPVAVEELFAAETLDEFRV